MFYKLVVITFFTDDRTDISVVGSGFCWLARLYSLLSKHFSCIISLHPHSSPKSTYIIIIANFKRWGLGFQEVGTLAEVTKLVPESLGVIVFRLSFSQVTLSTWGRKQGGHGFWLVARALTPAPQTPAVPHSPPHPAAHRKATTAATFWAGLIIPKSWQVLHKVGRALPS